MMWGIVGIIPRATLGEGEKTAISHPGNLDGADSAAQSL